MLFWIICGLLTLCVAGFVLRPMLHAPDAAPEGSDVVVYKAQLVEIDRDLARGVLAEADATEARTEVARRLLAADAAKAVATSEGPKRSAAIAVVAVLGVLSLATYAFVGTPEAPDQPLAQRLALSEALRENRPAQAALEAAMPPRPAVDAPAELIAAVTELRVVMADRPDDLTGLGFLARYEAELGNYAAAAAAQAQIVTLKGADAAIDERRLLLDLMVSAAGGFVSPEAEEILRAILEEDDQNIAARYHLGALYDQTDRPDVAFGLWRPLVDSGVETYHTGLARLQIAQTAARAGIDYTPPEVRGPGLDDIAAAEDMSIEDRTAMIGSMVNGLADRLATQGGPATDWARLIRAYGVLGETQIAAEVWTEANQVFGSDPGAVALLLEAAEAAGVAP